MRFGSALPPERRAAVERLLCETALTFAEIAVRTGVNRHTVATWNMRAGRPRPLRMSRRNGPATWRRERCEALVRLYREGRNDPGDLAEAAGVGRTEAAGLFRALGQVPRPTEPGIRRTSSRKIGPPDPPIAADEATLRGQLRAHVGRQIAAFDAALRGEGAAVLDSARVLRDLGGLKRLLDEVGEEAGRGGSETREGGGAGRPEPDIAALRADIARRYAGFVGDREPG